MIEMGKKYQTRDGRAVRVLATGMKGIFSVAGIVTEENSYEHIYSWQENGGAGDKLNSCSDLIPVPTKREGWVIISRTTGLPLADNCRGIWMDRSDAVAFCNEASCFVAHVTWED